ncbi:MAG: hypothetical protein FJX59_19285 [Alphaproteobacteria bacterium]|nr:hypothetical protein [Alphaproteobacteria bacterium]
MANMLRGAKLLWLGALGGLATVPASAQDPNRQLQDCRVIQNMASRLFCYDRVVDTLAAGSVAVPQPPAPVVPPATAPVYQTAPVAARSAIPPVPQAAVPVVQTQRVQPPIQPPVQATPAPVPVATATERFGAESVDAQKRRVQSKSDPDTMHAKISQTKKDRFGNATVTLDNGQTWRQTEGNPLNAPAGADIVIKKGVLGAYFLTLADSNRSIKVKRVE